MTLGDRVLTSLRYLRQMSGQGRGMAEKYDDVLLPFLSLMRKELHANAGKGDRPGWLRMDANTALLEVYWHAAKLSAAVKNNDGPAIMEHSADVANMAMMVLDLCGGLALVDACSSCGGSGSQGNGPGAGGCTDCLGTGVDPMSAPATAAKALDLNKAQICRVAPISHDNGQPCACPAETCKLWKGGLCPLGVQEVPRG